MKTITITLTEPEIRHVMWALGMAAGTAIERKGKPGAEEVLDANLRVANKIGGATAIESE